MVFLLSRCSPVTPSMPKLGNQRPSPDTVVYETYFLDVIDTSRVARETELSGGVVVSLPQSDDRFKKLRDESETEVQLNGPLPNYRYTLLVMDSVTGDAGSTPASVPELKAEWVRKTGSTDSWTLKIKRGSISEHDWQSFLSQLKGIMIVATPDKEFKSEAQSQKSQ